ncbi:ATP-grasp ribosomal peptide maturase [Nonomuraea sp. NBC_01738]|uniref:ATP-grasp ribosomal peptide maturase n=1 Tax=Nonomuraea sp. NBC_01738 TaxID=2976003 RepID=UPI002E1116F3|nr:ATP-grasp ribosomal peptide maturase [Nonomuraea sp. NBC_01738]
MPPSPTTVLVVTSLIDVTANMVIEVLNHRAVRVARIDPADLGSALTFHARIGAGRDAWDGRMSTPSREVVLGEVGAVYYRRPSPWRSDLADSQARQFVITEARHGLSGLLRTLPRCRYVNHPAATERADFKVAQLEVAAQVGMKIPKTLVTNDPEVARKFAQENDPVIYKSFRGVAPGADGSVSTIWAQRISSGDLDDSISLTAHLFQEEIQKTSDARVTVVGRSVFASRITTRDQSLDWRRGDWGELVHDDIDVPDALKTRLLAYLDAFGLTFGCFDFAVEERTSRDSGTWTFIECNPNGQWGWLPNCDAIANAFADTLLEGW